MVNGRKSRKAPHARLLTLLSLTVPQVTEAVSSPYVTVAALLSMPLGLTQADAEALVRLGSLLQLATLGARDITEDTELEPEMRVVVCGVG